MYTSWFSSTLGFPQHPAMPGSIQATWFLELSWFHCLLAAFDGAVKPAFLPGSSWETCWSDMLVKADAAFLWCGVRAVFMPSLTPTKKSNGTSSLIQQQIWKAGGERRCRPSKRKCSVQMHPVSSLLQCNLRL